MKVVNNYCHREVADAHISIGITNGKFANIDWSVATHVYNRPITQEEVIQVLKEALKMLEDK